MVVSAASLLAACSFSNRPDPQELIGRAVRATQALQSVAFDLSADVRLAIPGMIADGTLTASGAMVDHGKMIGGQVRFNGDAGQTAAKAPLTVDADLSYTAQGDVLLRVEKMNGAALAAVVSPSIQSLLVDRWVRVLRGSTGALVTPEPQLLTAEAEAVEVTEDMGDETIGSVDTVHYGIELNPEKLRVYLQRSAADRGQELAAATIEEQLKGLDASGEVWIDPKTALVHRLRWRVTRTGSEPVSFDLTMNLRSHNSASLAERPTNVTEWLQIIAEAAAAAPLSDSSSSSSPDAPDA